VSRYRAITGACRSGIKAWKESNGIDQDEVKAVELLAMLERTNAYGLSSFRKLCSWL